MLKTCRNTKTMEARVLRAFKKWYWRGISRQQRRRDRHQFQPGVFFEHGQWWAANNLSGAQWGAHDAEGSEASGVFDGFTFEKVTEGDEQ